MFVSRSQDMAQLASCFSLRCRLPCWLGFAVFLLPTSSWASLRHPGSNTTDLLYDGQYLCLQIWDLMKLSCTPLRTRSSWPPTGCCTAEGRGNWWALCSGRGGIVGLDGNGNGQNHYTALYTSLPFPVVPSDCPLKDKTKITASRPPPPSHSHL